MAEQSDARNLSKEIRATIIDEIAEQAGLADSGDRISESLDIRSDLDFDALDIVELQVVMEELFDITLDDDIWKSITTVKSVCDIVIGEVRAQKGLKL